MSADTKQAAPSAAAPSVATAAPSAAAPSAAAPSAATAALSAATAALSAAAPSAAPKAAPTIAAALPTTFDAVEAALKSAEAVDEKGDDKVEELVKEFKKKFNIPEDHPVPLDAELKAAIATDCKNRTVGGTGDIIPFAFGKLHMRPTSNFSDKIHVFRSRYGREQCCSSREVFVKRAQACRAIPSCVWERLSPKLVLAGGAVSSLITDQPVKDCDLFFVGMTDAEKIATIEEIVRAFAANNEVNVYRSARVITLKHDDIQVQFILRNYTHVSEVLHGFDLGSSAVAYDGSQVLTTTIGEFAYRHALNIVDLDKRRGSYEFRIAKYFLRGFGFALPAVTKLDGARTKIRFAAFEFQLTGLHRQSNPAEKTFFGYIFTGRGSPVSQTSEYDQTNRAYTAPPEFVAINSLKNALEGKTELITHAAEYRDAGNPNATELTTPQSTFIRALELYLGHPLVHEMLGSQSYTRVRALSEKARQAFFEALVKSAMPRTLFPIKFDTAEVGTKLLSNASHPTLPMKLEEWLPSQ